MERRVIRFNDQVRAGIIRILQNDVNVVIALALHAADASDDPIDVELLFADAVVRAWTAMRGDFVQGRDGRVDHMVHLNTAGAAVSKALHLGPAEGTTRREHRQHDGGDGTCDYFPPALQLSNLNAPTRVAQLNLPEET